MEKSFWIQELQGKLNSNQDLSKQFIYFDMHLYLFGSATWNNSPHDLDIVILYHRSHMRAAQAIRNITIRILRSQFTGPIDCMLISYDEEKQMNFLIKENAELIFPILSLEPSGNHMGPIRP